MPRAPRVRQALRGVLGAERRHTWSVEELRDRLAEEGVRADYSTVFRAAGRLEADGELERVELGDGRAHFEVRGEDHHEHLSCSSCGAVVAVPCLVVEEALASIADETGFVLSRHHLVVSGTCPACQADGARREAAPR